MLFALVYRTARNAGSPGTDIVAYDVEQLATFSPIGPGRGYHRCLFATAPGVVYTDYAAPVAGLPPLTGSLVGQPLYDPFRSGTQEI